MTGAQVTETAASAADALQLNLGGAGRFVFMCPGQGSQKPGLSADLVNMPVVHEVLTCAADVFGYDIVRACSQASQEELNDTRMAQAVLCALSLGTARALEASGVLPQAVVGFSLGQIPALGIAGMLSDEEVFRLANVRSKAMGRAADNHPGAMSAFLRSDAESVQCICDECGQGDVLVIANYNCPGQVVVAGDTAAIERAELAWSQQGKRSVRLATSGAFHTPLMRDARAELSEYLATVEFSEPSIPLICNTNAAPLRASQARLQLADQLIRPVLFQQSIEALVNAGARTFVEVGFGGVLVGLVRRIAPDAKCLCVQDAGSLEDALSLTS